MADREPDCKNCYYAETCEKAVEGTFCARWRSGEPQPKGPDPNEAWRTGEGEFNA